MSENNEYYADKMRRLLEMQNRADAPLLDNTENIGAKTANLGAEEIESEPAKDFEFKEKPKKREAEKPRNYEEKKARLEEAEAEARRVAGRKKKKSLKEIIISVFLVVAILVGGGFCVYNVFFVINNITVTGNNLYTTEQILASAGIVKGEKLYSFSSRIAEENIKMYCPEVEDLKVKRTPPGKIEILIEETKPVYYAEFYGETRGITADLRVLGSVTEEEKQSLIKLKLPEISRAVAGEKLRFADGGKDYVFEVAAAVFEAKLFSRIGTVDLSDPNDVKMTCDGKYILKLESYKDSGVKLKIAASVLEDDMFNNDNKATIDLGELSSTGVVIDNQLVIE